MTEEQRQEMISREFLKILAHAHGFKVTEPPLDHGVDMVINHVAQRVEPSGRTRYLDSQYKLDFQLKSKTPAGVIDANTVLKYDLDVKTYNDLVHRRNDVLPLHLVLIVLNNPPPTCVEIDLQRLSLIGCGYWYLTDQGALPSNNIATVRIENPKSQRARCDFCPELLCPTGDRIVKEQGADLREVARTLDAFLLENR